MDPTCDRMSAADYLALMAKQGSTLTKKRSKYGNQRGITKGAEKYDSKKEMKHHQVLELARRATEPAEQVIEVRRQVKYELLGKQVGERAVNYYADFVVRYADGRVEVQDTKSPPTRAISTYVIKRKLMLAMHGIRIREL